MRWTEYGIEYDRAIAIALRTHCKAYTVKLRYSLYDILHTTVTHLTSTRRREHLARVEYAVRIEQCLESTHHLDHRAALGEV